MPGLILLAAYVALAWWATGRIAAMVAERERREADDLPTIEELRERAGRTAG